MLLHMYKSPGEQPVEVTFSAAQENTQHRGRLPWPSASTGLRKSAAPHTLEGRCENKQIVEKYLQSGPFPHGVVDNFCKVMMVLAHRLAGRVATEASLFKRFKSPEWTPYLPDSSAVDCSP